MKRIVRLTPALLVVFVIFSISFDMCIANDENKAIDDNLIEIIFDLLYQEKGKEIEFNTGKLRLLLDKLDKYEEKHPDEKKEILFVKAESYYRLNEYKRAYVAFFQLKVRMNNKNDPLFSIVENRMKALITEVKSKKVDIEPAPKNKKLLYLPMGIFFIITLILIFYDAKNRRISRLDQQIYNSVIIPENELIICEDMRKQDGRCSKNAINEYRLLKKSWPNSVDLWDEVLDSEKEKLKNARLIFEGHEMIKEVNKLVPYPIAIISKIPYLNKISYFWQYTLVGIVFIGLWCLTNKAKLCCFKDPVAFLLLAAFVISCLYGIKVMAVKTINALDELISMLEPDSAKEAIDDLKIWIERLLRSPRQYYFFIVVMILIVLSLYQNDELTMEGGIINLDLLFSAFLVLISSSLIWFMTGSIILMNKIYNLKDLSMNPLSPSKTMGLEKLISVIGTYNIVSSMVLSFGCSIAVYEAYTKGQSIVHGSFWFFFITPMLVFYWIYPYIKIGNLVKTKKIKRMNFVKTKISLLFKDWEKSEDKILENSEEQKALGKENFEIEQNMKTTKDKINEKLLEMEKYYQVFKKIEQSPESYFDLNSALELGKVMGFPSLFAMISALISFYL